MQKNWQTINMLTNIHIDKIGVGQNPLSPDIIPPPNLIKYFCVIYGFNKFQFKSNYAFEW